MLRLIVRLHWFGDIALLITGYFRRGKGRPLAAVARALIFVELTRT